MVNILELRGVSELELTKLRYAVMPCYYCGEVATNHHNLLCHRCYNLLVSLPVGIKHIDKIALSFDIDGSPRCYTETGEVYVKIGGTWERGYRK